MGGLSSSTLIFYCSQEVLKVGFFFKATNNSDAIRLGNRILQYLINTTFCCVKALSLNVIESRQKKTFRALKIKYMQII